MRKHWHQQCADLWRIANNPSDARKYIFRREKGTCEKCGTKSLLVKDFQVDHIKPLFEANGDISFYLESNMQLLCTGCHKIKTKCDMVVFRAKNS